MRLLRTDCEDLKLDTYNDERRLPKFAILSHVWLAAEEEITFQDIGKDLDFAVREGWKKLDFARRQAHQDGFSYVWIDTCCIDKSSSAELAEAINSMYRWYSLAAVCYVHLEDMPEPLPPRHPSKTQPLMLDQQETSGWNWKQFSCCKWFTRGWTLQEMLAPTRVQFYSSSWTHIGDLPELAVIVAYITGVHIGALQRRWQIRTYSIAQRMSWAAKRQTTKIEDQAYSLLGLFELNLPIIYGEGHRAFVRLQEEILKVYSDPTTFAWLSLRPECSNEDVQTFQDAKRKRLDLLAKSPREFELCGRVVPIDEAVVEPFYELTDKGVRFKLPVLSRDIQNVQMVLGLRCCYDDDPTQILVMAVEKAQGSTDFYFATGGSICHVSEITSMPATWSRKSRSIVTEQLNVFRIAQQSHNQPPRQSGKDVITCRLIDDSGLDFDITQATPSGFWNASRSSFFLSETNTQTFNGQLTIKSSDDAWKPVSFKINIAASRDDFEAGWKLSLTIDQLPDQRLWTIPYTAFSAMGIGSYSFYNGSSRTLCPRALTIMTSFQDKIEINQQAPLVDIDIFWNHPLRQLWYGLRFLGWCVFVFALLPCAIIAPVFAILGVRSGAYQGSDKVPDVSYTTSDLIALGVGLPFTCLLGAWLLLGSRVYLLWQALSWRRPMLWALRISSLLVGILFLASDSKAHAYQNPFFEPYTRLATGSYSLFAAVSSLMPLLHLELY